MLTDTEILKKALEDGILDITTIKQNIALNERRKYLSVHPYQIYEGSDGKWYTYLPDENTKRKKIKRNTETEIEDIVVAYHKAHEVRPKIEDVFELWIGSKIRYGEIKPSTVDRYRNDFDKYLKNSILNDKAIYLIDDYDLEDYIKSTIHDYGLSSKRYSGIRTLIKGIFKHAKKIQETDLSISEFFGDLELSNKIFTKKRVKSKDQVFTDGEFAKIEKFVLEHKFSFVNQAILFAFYTGMRAGEIVALRKIDVHDDYVEVNQSEIHYKGEDGHQVYEIQDSPKTECGFRKVYLTDEAKFIVQTMLKHKSTQNTEYLFINDELNVMHGYVLSHKLYRICDKVGINRRSLHKCRKTYATKLINNNVSKKVVQEQMGHSDIKTTESYYYFNNLNDGETRDQVIKALVY